MHILQVSRVYWPNIGGMERVVQGLSEALVTRGHQVDVVTLDTAFEDGRPLPPYEVHGGIRVYRVPFLGSTRFPIAPRARRLFREHDLVHVHGVDGLLEGFARPKVSVPLVLTPHGGFFHTNRDSAAKELWFRTATRATLGRVDAVACTSKHDLGMFQQISGRCVFTPSGVDMDDLSTIRVRPRAGHWATVGRVDVHKGLDQLIEAFALASHRGVADQLTIVGPWVVAGLVPQLEALARSLGVGEHVTFTGRVSRGEVRNILGTCEVAMFPSTYEAFGISVVEALAAGAMVIANDIGAHGDLIVSGENGFLADFSKPEQVLLVVQQNREEGKLRPKRRKAARLSAQEHTWSATVSRTEALYQRLLSMTP